MSTRLFIGNLSYQTSDEDLANAFGEVGNVTSARVIMDKFSGRSRGFGFVEYATEEEANKAIEKFNNGDLGGRTIVVNIARPMEDRPPRREF